MTARDITCPLIALLLLAVSYAPAATRHWTGNSNSSWSTPSNWDTGVPAIGDTVVIDTGPAVFVDNTAINLDDFSIYNGRQLNTNGFRLRVHDDNFGLMQIDGSGTRITVIPETIGFGQGLDTDSMLITNGGELLLNDAEVQVDDQLTVDASSSVTGYGTLDLRNDASRTEPLYDNAGSLTATGGDLSLITPTGGAIDLDGLGSNDGQGTLSVTENAHTLSIDATLSDPFGGSLAIGLGNAIHFTQAIDLDDPTLVFVIDAGDTPTRDDLHEVLTAPTVTGSIGALIASPFNGHVPYTTILEPTRLLVTPATDGDANADGTVGPADLTILKINWNQTNVSWAQADFDNNNSVGPADLTLMKLNWPNNAFPNPEPSTLLLLTLAGVPLLTRPRTRIRH